MTLVSIGLGEWAAVAILAGTNPAADTDRPAWRRINFERGFHIEVLRFSVSEVDWHRNDLSR